MEDYLDLRIQEFMDYPTSMILDHARNIIESYLKSPNYNVSKSDVDWMLTYFSSSEFLDCGNHPGDKISDNYKKGLELLAKVEYFAVYSPDERVSSVANEYISLLEQKAGCFDFD
ncbi:MAG: hypothetical protein ACOCUR_01130 [Nanoarchaeota archaeon]